MEDDLGFIMTRCVKDKKADKYWQLCYDCIRTYYPENKIVIIDDNSDDNFLSKKELYKTNIIQSEFPGRGELLRYYYYSKYKFFDTAVILHDSVFINTHIDFKTDTYRFLWHFKHYWDNVDNETKIIQSLGNETLLRFYNSKSKWVGCFGGMCVIKYDYLQFINDKYDLTRLLDHIKTRDDRCAFERVIACMLQLHGKQQSMFGEIHLYMKWGTPYEEINNYKHLPIIKCWVGR